MKLSSANIVLLILRGGNPATTLTLGERVELRWEIINENEQQKNFRIKECIAEQPGQSSDESASLVLIKDG